MSLGKLSGSDGTDAQILLSRIRNGHQDELGRLFERYRNYIELIASMGLPELLQGKVDASDVVQETFVRAHNGFSEFRGTVEPEFRAWLQQILASEIATVSRRYLDTKKRDVRLEREVRQALDQSSMQLERALFAPDTTPSQMAAKRENGVRLADALRELSDEERQIVIMHNLQEMPFTEISKRLGTTVDRLYGIWSKAIRRLKKTLEETS